MNKRESEIRALFDSLDVLTTMDEITSIANVDNAVRIFINRLSPVSQAAAYDLTKFWEVELEMYHNSFREFHKKITYEDFDDISVEYQSRKYRAKTGKTAQRRVSDFITALLNQYYIKRIV